MTAAVAPPREPHTDVLVVAPGLLPAAFRIAGVRTVRADDAAQAQAAVEAELAAPAAGIVAVHHTLWQRFPGAVRREWEQSLQPLVVPLPADTGRVGADRGQALRDLLTQSVGYEITFTTQGESS